MNTNTALIDLDEYYRLRKMEEELLRGKVVYINYHDSVREYINPTKAIEDIAKVNKELSDTNDRLIASSNKLVRKLRKLDEDTFSDKVELVELKAELRKIKSMGIIEFWKHKRQINKSK